MTLAISIIDDGIGMPRLGDGQRFGCHRVGCFCLFTAAAWLPSLPVAEATARDRRSPGLTARLVTRLIIVSRHIVESPSLRRAATAWGDQ